MWSPIYEPARGRWKVNEKSDKNYTSRRMPAICEPKFGKVIPPEILALINKLQNNYEFFWDMEDKEVGQFLKMCHQENLEKGDKVFQEGDSGNDFYLIVSGEISICVGQKEVAQMKQGQVFGEMAMFDDARRTATAIAAEPTLLFSITRDVLSSKMPKFANKVTGSIARQLSDKLREANGIIQTLQKQLEQTVTLIKSRSPNP